METMLTDVLGSSPPVLEMRGISKTFPGVKALDSVSLTVRQGEILALMGENGAGKSTLMKVLSGAYLADPGGQMLMHGQPVSVTCPADAKRLGIAIIYQELSLAPNLTVAENIFIGEEPRRGPFVDRAAMRAGAQELLDRLGVGFGADTEVGTLSIAEQQMVEIARALRVRSKVLVMDEPTTALSSRETERLFALMLRLKQDGLGIVYISHRMAEIYELADRVSVLRDGTYVGTLDRAEINPETLVRMMVGRKLDSFYAKQHSAEAARGPVALTVEGLRDQRGRVRGCGFTLRYGEVLGVAGLVGAGRTELARLIYGADPLAGGGITLDGRPVTIRGPGDALRLGISYLTEDRKRQGLFLDMSVHDNINIGVVDRDARPGGLLNRSRAADRTSDAVSALGIRVAHPRVNVGSLSGGNQQKTLLSRWLEMKPRVLILDEPTRGVDIGAKSEIYRIIDRLAQAGVAILVISSELPELIGVADRILVMREGEIAGEVGGASGVAVTQENIVALATGAAVDSAAAA
ncbi:ribose transport system ATP-binding protein [Azospirillum lipoferum]|nr:MULTISPECIES: sugar ABC transporter ATP-binding protein [Azospirillum]MCP1615419.1 ribose transport system ATP-binding protein [Azospirillum lipoferum]MDW5532950.1 sugar ABC transporter ATP-binding protein [Azospirillum sp. NL1]